MVVRRPELGRWGDDDGWPGFPVKLSVLQPAAGEGQVAEVLREYFDQVHASDVFGYGAGYQIASFVGDGVDVIEARAGGIDWVITNPPLILALDFALRCLETRLVLIAPGQRVALTKPGDRARFASWSTDDALPLFWDDRQTSTATAPEPR